MLEDRLVTLVRSGGFGKTRLALAVARDVAIQFRDGAWFVPLAGLTDPVLDARIGLAGPGVGGIRRGVVAGLDLGPAAKVITRNVP